MIAWLLATAHRWRTGHNTWSETLVRGENARSEYHCSCGKEWRG